MLFPHFLATNFLNKIIGLYKWPNRDLGFSATPATGAVHQDVDGRHDSLIDCPVLLLLAHSLAQPMQQRHLSTAMIGLWNAV